MCGRYILSRDPAGLARHFETTGPTPNHPASWNMAPTQDGLVVRRNPQTGARHLDVLRWGLVPRWAKDASGGARLINARAETLTEKPSFREAFRQRRCLVPMDGFYEWTSRLRPDAGGAKRPFAVALRDGAPMGVAALWEGWKQPDGTWLRTYSVITCRALGRQALLHERIPVILSPESWPAWLGEVPADATELAGLLKPVEDALLAFWPVAARVGRVAENDARLMAPLSTEPGEIPPELNDAPPPWVAKASPFGEAQ